MLDGMRLHRLYRSRNKVIAGVCGGLAEYLGVDPSLLRLLAAATLATTIIAGLLPIALLLTLLYLTACAIIPEQPIEKHKAT